MDEPRDPVKTLAPPRKTNRHGQPIHEFMVRLDEDLYAQVRERAHAESVALADVIRMALRYYLAA